MNAWGIERIAVFEGRQRRLEPLGSATVDASAEQSSR